METAIIVMVVVCIAMDLAVYFVTIHVALPVFHHPTNHHIY